MTNQEKIRWLKRYTILGRRVHNHLERCEEMRSELGKITAILSLVPAGGGSINKHRDTDIINKLVDRMVEFERDMNDWEDARIQIRNAITVIDDDRYRELLEYRYLDGRTFEWIASQMHYNWRWIHTLHSRALDMIKIGGYNAKEEL